MRGQVGLRPLRADGKQALYPFADATPRTLGCYALTEQHKLHCRIVLLRRPPKQRHQALRRSAGRARGGKALKPSPCPDTGMARAAREPWLLAHSESLNPYSPALIAHWYALRMQIESSFRDLKSHRFGCAFEDTLTRSAARLEVLLLIHLLATLVAWLAALAAVARHEYRFRISLLRRGWESLRSGGRRIESPRHALARLQRLAEQSAGAP